MKLKSSALLILLVSGAAGLLSGCLERKERIILKPDLSVVLSTTFSGTHDDLKGGPNSHPSEALGLQITYSEEKSPNGDNRGVLTSDNQHYKSVSEMPGSWVLPRKMEADLQLQWSQELVRRRRSDGTETLSFVRTYKPRFYADMAAARLRAGLDELDTEVKKEKDVRKLPAALKERWLSALLRFERDKWLNFSARAEKHLETIARELTPAEHWAARLRVDTAIRKFAETQYKVDTLLELLKSEDTAIVTRAREIESALKEVVRQALNEFYSGNNEAASRHFESFERAHREYLITEDLEDETFEIDLQVPGTILESNGQRQGSSRVVWKFSGRELRDQEVRLLVEFSAAQ